MQVSSWKALMKRLSARKCRARGWCRWFFCNLLNMNSISNSLNISDLLFFLLALHFFNLASCLYLACLSWSFFIFVVHFLFLSFSLVKKSFDLDFSLIYVFSWLSWKNKSLNIFKFNKFFSIFISNNYQMIGLFKVFCKNKKILKNINLRHLLTTKFLMWLDRHYLTRSTVHLFCWKD